jgi:glycogen synthase
MPYTSRLLLAILGATDLLSPSPMARHSINSLTASDLTPAGPLPVRVLMTSDTVGGVWNYSINLIRALASHRVEVVLATMGKRPSAAQRREASAISNLWLVDSEFKLEWMDDPWTDVSRAGNWLLQLEAIWKPSLIHLNGYSHATLPWHAPCLVVGHSCVLSWWSAVRRVPLSGRWLTYAKRVAAGLNAAELVIAPSAAMLAELRRLYAWYGDGVVIWNGLPSAPECGRMAKEEFVLTVGRLWDEAKNLSAVESVAPQLSWPVYAAGEGESSLRDSCIRRLGFLPAAEITDWMGRASIYALPAHYEPFGLSILEAALSGCALVIGEIPSLYELWEGAAWFVPPDDSSQLSDALMNLIAYPNLRDQFAARARDHARQYGAERMTQRYLAVYRNLLESSCTTCA